MKVTAIITCAGKGTRAGFDKNKLLQKTDGITYLEKTANVFLGCELIDNLVITSSANDLEEISKITANFNKKTTVILGGDTRTESIKNALNACNDDIVLIHDGARPFVTEEIIIDCINSVKKYGSGIACTPLADTLAVEQNGEIVCTERENRYLVQTPQGFYLKDIVFAYSQIKEGEAFTDDSGVYSKYIKPAKISLGSPDNKKLTYASDFNKTQLVGTGFDLHRLVEDRKLILGGIEIPHTKGLLGHSDADVLTHAIMDALLSALSLGDIGKHFKDTDPQWKDISSIYLLKKVLEMIQNEGYKVVNISAVIMAQKPKLSTFTDKISTNLAQVIHIEPKRMGITCTTLEGVGLVGREEAIATQAYCLLEKI